VTEQVNEGKAQAAAEQCALAVEVAVKAEVLEQALAEIAFAQTVGKEQPIN